MIPPRVPFTAASHVDVAVPGGTLAVPVRDARVAIVGSGAAGLNCAIHLVEEGLPSNDIAIITDSWGGGTSHNAGSDKQTYYKLSLAGEPDSPLVMARELHAGGSMHGDMALVESAVSVEEFFHLVRLGVKFPRNDHGMYPGYKTDNDPRQRATSVGPYTSKAMVEALAARVVELGIPVFDGYLAIAVLVAGAPGSRLVTGLAAIDLQAMPTGPPSLATMPVRVVRAPRVVLATGGPANIYGDSVYPANQHCAHGLGIHAGARLQNLAFMQHGIASKSFRWNLSGSFQQVIPAYRCLEPGSDDVDAAPELLSPHLPDPLDAAYQTFLKGYHWPFNPARCDLAAPNHSSIIDAIVFHATVLEGRRVFLDFRCNPWDLAGRPVHPRDLPLEARGYLAAAGAIDLPRPVDRLRALNPAAIQVYLDHGIDLDREPVEIHVAAQHCNGGIATDARWESINVPGLHAVGEVNGSHGQHRPGGAALNAGQVGGLRVARHVASVVDRYVDPGTFALAAEGSLGPVLVRLHGAIEAGHRGHGMALDDAWVELRSRMNRAGGIARDTGTLVDAVDGAAAMVRAILAGLPARTGPDLASFIRLDDAAITQLVVLSAMKEQLHVEGERVHPCYLPISLAALDPAELAAASRHVPAGDARNAILESGWNGAAVEHAWVEARPVPDVRDVFELLLQGVHRRDG